MTSHKWGGVVILRHNIKRHKGVTDVMWGGSKKDQNCMTSFANDPLTEKKDILTRLVISWDSPSSAFAVFFSKTVFRWKNYKEKLRFCTLTNLNLGLELYFLTRLIPNCYLDAENYRYLVFKAKKVEVQSWSQYRTFKNRKHSKTRLFGLWYSNGSTIWIPSQNVQHSWIVHRVIHFGNHLVFVPLEYQTIPQLDTFGPFEYGTHPGFGYPLCTFRRIFAVNFFSFRGKLNKSS